MSDPKDPQRLFDNRHLYATPENMAEARNRFWRAYVANARYEPDFEKDRHIWDIAWAAAIAAVDYTMGGNLGPKSEE